MKVLLDTNFWIYVAKYRLFDKLKEMNVELILLEPIRRELGLLSKRQKEGINASVSLEMIQKWGIKPIESKERSADRAILKYAMENKGEVKVATMDKELSEMLKKEGIEIIIIRQKRDFLE